MFTFVMKYLVCMIFILLWFSQEVNQLDATSHNSSRGKKIKNIKYSFKTSLFASFMSTPLLFCGFP